MKSLLLSLFSFFFSVFFCVALLRLYRGKNYLKFFFISYLAFLTAYVIFYRASPNNLWFFPESVLEQNQTIDFWNGLLIFSLLFHCFTDVSYTTILTGFATNLLIHIREKEGLTENEIHKIYGVRDDVDPVLHWRIDYLLQKKYIAPDASGYKLLFKGKVMAGIGLFLQRLFHTGECG